MIGRILRIRYELLQEIGDNPIFMTFIAHDRVSERNVVVRMLKPKLNTEKPFIDALRKCIEDSKKLKHPKIAEALDMDEDSGEWFLVFRHCPGNSLSERMRKMSVFALPSALNTAEGVLDALTEVHKRGLVHGEISARNVVTNPKDETF